MLLDLGCYTRETQQLFIAPTSRFDFEHMGNYVWNMEEVFVHNVPKNNNLSQFLKIFYDFGYIPRIQVAIRESLRFWLCFWSSFSKQVSNQMKMNFRNPKTILLRKNLVTIASFSFYIGIIYWDIFNFLGHLFQKIKFSNFSWLF